MQELEKTKRDLEHDIIKSNQGNLYVQTLPKKGLTQDEVMNKIGTYLKMSVTDWKNGGVSGCVYGAEDHLTELTTRVYEKFAWSNPMHADVFPDVRKMEAEVVRMVCNMFNGDENTCGTVMFKIKIFLCANLLSLAVFQMTSGGTESIMLACKAYRDLAYSKGIKRPEM